MPAHFDSADGQPVAIETYVHLLSAHMAADAVRGLCCFGAARSSYRRRLGPSKAEVGALPRVACQLRLGLAHARVNVAATNHVVSSLNVVATTTAEGVGFEPTVSCPTVVFKTTPFGRSGIPPPTRLPARRYRARRMAGFAREDRATVTASRRTGLDGATRAAPTPAALRGLEAQQQEPEGRPRTAVPTRSAELGADWWHGIEFVDAASAPGRRVPRRCSQAIVFVVVLALAWFLVFPVALFLRRPRDHPADRGRRASRVRVLVPAAVEDRATTGEPIDRVPQLGRRRRCGRAPTRSTPWPGSSRRGTPPRRHRSRTAMSFGGYGKVCTRHDASRPGTGDAENGHADRRDLRRSARRAHARARTSRSAISSTTSASFAIVFTGAAKKDPDAPAQGPPPDASRLGDDWRTRIPPGPRAASRTPGATRRRGPG